MNPLLPLNHFVPDGEARPMPDGRLYLYGSYDISGETTYCSDVLHVFSTDNMTDWTDHGVVLKSEDIPWAPAGSMMYAPDCIYKDGKYYLYFCMSSAVEGVAVSDTPYGPFVDPKPVDYANGNSIDPAVFVDDDGQAYYFWGQFHLCGAKLNPDMHTLDRNTLNERVLDEKCHGFHEGSSIRKRNGLYYMVYTDTSRGKATCMSYAVARSPLGPYTKRGVIVDNIFCDPATWNNHGSIECYKGQWYVFYHRSSQNSMFSRRMCAEPIHFEEDGSIREVCMTTQGSASPLAAPGQIPAGRACQVRNGVYIAPNAAAAEGEEEILTHASSGSFAAYRYVDFRSPKTAVITAAALVNGGLVEVWADQELIGCCKVEPTGGWNRFKEFTCELKDVRGLKTLYLVFQGANPGARLMEIKEVVFQ